MARVSRRKQIAAAQGVPVDELPKAAVLRIFRTALYVRLSIMDTRDRKDSESLQTQIDYLCGYIAKHPDLELYDCYRDNGETGTNFERPGFQRMMEDVKAGRVDCIIVKDLSRFGRDFLETGNFLEKVLPFMGVRFISVKSPEDRHKLAVDPDAAKVVRRIFRMKKDGMSNAAIARTLTAEQIPNPNYHRYLQGIIFAKRFSENAPWQTQTVKHILENPVYLGHMAQGKKITKLHAGQKQKTMPSSEWIIVPNTHEAIIEQELFDAVQAILKAKHEEYHSRLGKYAHFDIENIFEGLVACACCQHNMTRYKSVYNKGRTVAYHFICPRHAMLLDAGCPNAGGLRESDLEAAVYEVLRLQMAMLTDAEAVIQRVSRSSAARSRRTALDNEIVSVQGRLKKLATLRQTLFESYVDGIVTQADYLFGKSRYEDEARQLEGRLRDLQAEKDALPEASPKQNKWFSAFAKFRDEKEPTREMLLALVEKIYVNEDKQVHIVLNYQDEMKKLFQEEV